METKPFAELAPKMKTGDLVLFSGRYEESTLIEKLEHSPWSHVGMVVKLPDHGQPLFWESTTLTNLADEIFHDHMKGPKVVDLYQRMKQYGRELKPYVPAQFAYRKLDVARTEAMIQSLTGMFTDEHGLPNPGEWKMVAEVVAGRLFNIHSRLDTFFCSELVADSYVKMRLLPAERAVNAYMPKDFTSTGRLPLLKGRLEPEILIDL
jgi:hypothetical protein